MKWSTLVQKSLNHITMTYTTLTTSKLSSGLTYLSNWIKESKILYEDEAFLQAEKHFEDLRRELYLNINGKEWGLKMITLDSRISKVNSSE